MKTKFKKIIREIRIDSLLSVDQRTGNVKEISESKDIDTKQKFRATRTTEEVQ